MHNSKKNKTHTNLENFFLRERPVDENGWQQVCSTYIRATGTDIDVYLTDK